MTGIYNKLKADGTLTTALGGTAANGYKCYYSIAPQGTAEPYLTFGMMTDTPENFFGEVAAIEDATVYINIFSSSGSGKEAGTLFGYVDAVMNDASLTVTGYTTMKCLREYVGTTTWDPETRVFMIPTRYRVWLDKT